MGDRIRWDRSFRLLWISQSASVTGLSVTGLVIPVLLYQLTGSAMLTAASVALSVLPYTVFGLVAGAMADRRDRRRMILGFDLANGVLLASIPVADLLGVLSLAQLYAVAIGSASLWVWSDAAFFGAVPTVVGREAIAVANARLYSARMVISIVAPAGTGTLIATIGASPAVWLGVVSMIVSAASVAGIKRPLQLGRSADDARGSLRTDIAEGLRFVWSHPLVRPLTLLGIGNSVSGGAVYGLLVVYAVEALGLADDDPLLGWLYAVGGAGALAATLALPRLVRRYSVEWITLAGLAGHVVLVMALVPLADVAVALPILFAWQATYLLVIVNGITLRQQVTPERLQSRVNTTARMIATAGAPVGAVLGGAVAATAGVRWALVAGAAGVAASAILGWCSPLRRAPRFTNAGTRSPGRRSVPER